MDSSIPTSISPSNTATPKKLELIQVFRGLASVAVLLTHCGLVFEQNFAHPFLNKIFDFGGAGVDFFFVLSGFIIYYIHEKDFEQPQKVKSFFIKRLIRVYPLYWLVLGLKIFTSLLLGYDPDVKARNFLEIFQAIVLFPQDRAILSSSFLGVSWTLSFEVFFYLIFGLAILFPKRVMFPLIGTWLLGSFASLIGLTPLQPGTMLRDFWFSPLNLEFALGCWSAYLVRRYRFSHGQGIFGVGLFLLSISIALEIYTTTHGLPPNLMPTVIAYGIPCWILIIGAVTLESERTVRVSPILSEIGNASYSIYLMHGFFLNNLSKLLPKISETLPNTPWLLNTSGIVLSILSLLFSYGVYKYIEKPMLEFCRDKFIHSKPT